MFARDMKKNYKTYLTIFDMTQLMKRVQMKGILRNSLSFEKKPYQLNKEGQAAIASSLRRMIYFGVAIIHFILVLLSKIINSLLKSLRSRLKGREVICLEMLNSGRRMNKKLEKSKKN